MSAEIVEVSGRIITVKLAGELKYTEIAAVQKAAAKAIEEQGKIRILVLLDNVSGMEKSGNWGDVSFTAKYDPYIEKLAIVGEKRLEDMALLFTAKGIRNVSIEYFLPVDLERARAWLAAND